MNKGQLIENVSSDANISKTDASKAVESFLSNTTKTLKSGENLTIVGFGTFSVKKRNARTGRNPRTGESIDIPSKNVVKFKPGSSLSDSVNN